MPKKREGTHYIDNKRFLEELVQHKKVVAKAKKSGIKPPGVTNYIGQCFLDIANNLAKKPNFANYTYKDEMISDSVENCIMYATNFDPKKSTNPFAFFTQIIYYAFLRRIQKEKKQLFIKMKCFEQNDPTGKFRNWMEDQHMNYEDSSQSPYTEFIQNDSYVSESMKPKKKKKKKLNKSKPASRLDDLLED